MKIARCFNSLVLAGAALGAACAGTGEHDAGGPSAGASATSGSTDTTSDTAGSTDTAAATGAGGSQASSGGADNGGSSGNAGGGSTLGGSGGVSAGTGGASSTVGMEAAAAGGAGSGATASDSDGAGGAGGASNGGTCVDVSHIDERQTDDLQVIGTGFEADEGHMIRILATHGEPTYGLGEAPIQDGSFDILLPGVLGDYTGLAVHIDRVRDNACNPDEELIWQMTTGPAPGNTVWEVTPDTLMVFDQVGPCSLNGIFDLTTALPCSAEN